MITVGSHVRIQPPFDTVFPGVYLVDAIKENGTIVICGSRDFAPMYCAETQDPLTDYSYITEDGGGVPEKISASQARAVLLQQNLLSTVQALVDDPNTPEIIRIFWNHEHEFNRDSPALNQMAASLGLSQQQLDAMFIAAANIRV